MDTLHDFERLPNEIDRHLIEVAKKWRDCEARPCIPNSVLKHWDQLVEYWLNDDTLPIYIRRASKGRGTAIQHRQGRMIHLCDNTPANWSFAMAYQGFTWTWAEMKVTIQQNGIPLAFAIPKNEREGIIITGSKRSNLDVNKKGWKVCHIEPVGLEIRGEISDMPLEYLEERFRRLISPSNMFLVPKRFSGLGELPQVIEIMKECQFSHRG